MTLCDAISWTKLQGKQCINLIRFSHREACFPDSESLFRSLRWLKAGHEPTVEREMSRLQAEAKEQNVLGKSIGISDLFRDKATIKGLVITLGLFGGQQFCGIFVMVKMQRCYRPSFLLHSFKSPLSFADQLHGNDL